MKDDVMMDGGMFHLAYGRLLRELHEAGVEETNARTGSRIKTLPGAASFKVDLRNGRLPVCGHRKLHPRTMAAEVAWFVSGTKDVTWLAQYAPIWNKFVEDDGRTIDAAYGYRWTTHFKRNQLDDSVFALSTNPSDRRVYVGTWDPGSDGLGRPNQKNVPCPVGFTLSIVGGELHSSVLLRSSDVFVGLPYDVGGHAILMSVLAKSIMLKDGKPVRLGSMHVTLAHPHLYEAHYPLALEALARSSSHTSLCMPSDWSLLQVRENPDGFVEAYSQLGKAMEWPSFNPRPELVV